MTAIVAAGIYEEDFAFSGADVGDVVSVTYSTELAGGTLTGSVPAPNVVRVQLVNNTPSTLTVNVGDLHITVYK